MRVYIYLAIMVVILAILIYVNKTAEGYADGSVLDPLPYSAVNPARHEYGKPIGYDWEKGIAYFKANRELSYGNDMDYGWFKDPNFVSTDDHCKATKLPNCEEVDTEGKCKKCILKNPSLDEVHPLQLFLPNYPTDPVKKGMGGCKLNPVALMERYRPGYDYRCPWNGVWYQGGPYGGGGNGHTHPPTPISYAEYRNTSYDGKDTTDTSSSFVAGSDAAYHMTRCNMPLKSLKERITKGVVENGIDYSKIEALPAGADNDYISGFWTNIDKWAPYFGTSLIDSTRANSFASVKEPNTVPFIRPTHRLANQFCRASYSDKGGGSTCTQKDLDFHMQYGYTDYPFLWEKADRSGAPLIKGDIKGAF